MQTIQFISSLGTVYNLYTPAT